MTTETLRRLLGELRRFLSAVEDAIRKIDAELQASKEIWPSHQVVTVEDWKSREIVPPPGKIWASNGDAVWLISSDGKGIPDGASAVKFWTAALIPAPPVLPPPASDA